MANNGLSRMVKGALIGVGAILPGISGGVLCVVLGIYQPIMALLSNPFTQIKARWRFFLPIIIGFALGVLGLSRVVDWLFRTSETPAVWLFIGLITGTLPSLFKEAGGCKNTKGGWIALCAGFAAMFALFTVFKAAGQNSVSPSFFWWLLCGVLWGIGLIVPGLSPSSFFIFLGLYQPMTAGIADLSMAVILPMALGLLATVVLLARGMRFLLKKAYGIVMNAILGIVIASTAAILPFDASASGLDIALYALCFLSGLFIALVMTAREKAIEKA